MSSRCFALSAVLTRHATQATRPHAMTSTTTTANTMTHYTVCSTHQPPLAVGLCQNEYPVHFESAAAVQCVMLLLHTQQVFSKLRVSFLFIWGFVEVHTLHVLQKRKTKTPNGLRLLEPRSPILFISAHFFIPVTYVTFSLFLCDCLHLMRWQTSPLFSPPLCLEILRFRIVVLLLGMSVWLLFYPLSTIKGFDFQNQTRREGTTTYQQPLINNKTIAKDFGPRKSLMVLVSRMVPGVSEDACLRRMVFGKIEAGSGNAGRCPGSLRFAAGPCVSGWGMGGGSAAHAWPSRVPHV